MMPNMLPQNFYMEELPTTSAILWTSLNSGRYVILTNLVFTNTSASARTATIVIDEQDSEGPTTTLIHALAMAPSETVVVDVKVPFFCDIVGYASGAGVNAFISGLYQENTSS